MPIPVKGVLPTELCEQFLKTDVLKKKIDRNLNNLMIDNKHILNAIKVKQKQKKHFVLMWSSKATNLKAIY